MMGFLQSQLGHDPILVEGLFPASPERLFRAWTRSEEVVQWFGGRAGGLVSARIDLRVGGRWAFVVHDEPTRNSRLEGEYLDIQPATLLRFTWRHVVEASSGSEFTPYSIVTITFTPIGAATRVDLRHEGIEQLDGRRGVGGGWDRSFERLRTWLTSGVETDG